MFNKLANTRAKTTDRRWHRNRACNNPTVLRVEGKRQYSKKCGRCAACTQKARCSDMDWMMTIGWFINEHLDDWEARLKIAKEMSDLGLYPGK